MEGYVYLLQDDNNKRYVGSTNDINRRMSEHKRKHSNSKFTKTGSNWKLVYFERFDTIEEARIFERSIKKNKSIRNKFYKRFENNIGA